VTYNAERPIRLKFPDYFATRSQTFAHAICNRTPEVANYQQVVTSHMLSANNNNNNNAIYIAKIHAQQQMGCRVISVQTERLSA